MLPSPGLWNYWEEWWGCGVTMCHGQAPIACVCFSAPGGRGMKVCHAAEEDHGRSPLQPGGAGQQRCSLRQPERDGH